MPVMPTRSAMARLARMTASLWLACAAGTAFAAPAAGTGDCEVLASGQLRSNDYIASYQGGCKAGKADGQGKAEWAENCRKNT